MYDVVIIGAGLSGVACAKTLIELHPDLRIVIVEANDRIGGRVNSIDGIEYGAELIHGNQTILTEWLAEYKCATLPVYTWAMGDGGPHPDVPVRGGVGYYYTGNQLLCSTSTDPEFIHLNQVLRSISENVSDSGNESVSVSGNVSENESESKSGNESVYDYLISHNVSERMISLAEAGFANTLCSRLVELPVRQTARLMTSFDDDGDTEQVCQGGFQPLLEALVRSLTLKGVTFHLNWVVHHVDWNAYGVHLVSETGERVHARRVVCTVSIGVLKELARAFDPPFDTDRLRIIDTIPMEACLKLAVRFRPEFRAFLPSDFHGMICADSPVPEFWLKQDERDTVTLMGFASADYAIRLAALSKEQCIETVLNQLDRMFTSDATSKDTTATATLASPKDAFIDLTIYDWTADRFVRGGYRSPGKVTEEEIGRMTSPIEDTIYFAGEHTNATRYTVMHSAIESGIRVAHEINLVK